MIDYTKEDFAQNSEIYDVIFDAVGMTSFSSCMKSLTKEGVYLQAVALPLLSARMGLTSLFSSKTLIGGTAIPQKENLILLQELVEEGEIKPVNDRTYPLEQIVEAHRYVDKGHKKGNVVLTVG